MHALLYTVITIPKSRIHANLSGRLYLFFYFMNKCDGLAKIKATQIFVRWLKSVKSLTIVGTGA
jgi:hypothetical protein